MNQGALLLLAALITPAAAQGPIAILDAHPHPDSLLEQDLKELLGEAPPLIIRLELTGPSDLDDPERARLALADTKSADSRVLAERVRSAGSVVLEGGSLLGWYKTLHRADRPTRLVHALLRHTREGRALIGIGGAGAALAGAGIIVTAELDRVPRNPRRTHALGARVALGWGPPALIDATTWSGDAMRTLRLMERSYMVQAAHLGPSSGLVLEPRQRRVRVIGGGSVVFFETDPGHRNRHDLRGGRVSLLMRGDVWDLPHRRLIPTPDALSPPEAAGALPKLLAALSFAPSEELALQSPWGQLLLRRQQDTRILGAGTLARPIRAEFDLFLSP